MRYGQLNTNKRWSVLLGELKDELERWGVRDYVLPTYEESRLNGKVTLQMAKRGPWFPVSCGVFTHQSQGHEKNLAAIKEAIRAFRLADQRGISGVFKQVSQFLALPDPDDPYTVLGLAKAQNPTHQQIRDAYLEKVKATHPDRGGDSASFTRVQKAGEILGVAGLAGRQN